MARRKQTLGFRSDEHEQRAMQKYHSAEGFADRAVKAKSCAAKLESYQSALRMYGRAQAHEDSMAAGLGFEVEARRRNATMAMADAERAVRKCLRK